MEHALKQAHMASNVDVSQAIRAMIVQRLVTVLTLATRGVDSLQLSATALSQMQASSTEFHSHVVVRLLVVLAALIRTVVIHYQLAILWLNSVRLCQTLTHVLRRAESVKAKHIKFSFNAIFS